MSRHLIIFSFHQLIGKRLSQSRKNENLTFSVVRECFILLGYADSPPLYAYSTVKSAGSTRGQTRSNEDWLIAGHNQLMMAAEKLDRERRQLFTMTRMKYFLFINFFLKGKRNKKKQARNRFLCAARAIDQLQTEKVCLAERMSDLGPLDGCLRVYYKPFGRGYNLRRAKQEPKRSQKRGEQKRKGENSGQQNDRTNGCVHPFRQVPPPISS